MTAIFFGEFYHSPSADAQLLTANSAWKPPINCNHHPRKIPNASSIKATLTRLTLLFFLNPPWRQAEISGSPLTGLILHRY